MIKYHIDKLKRYNGIQSKARLNTNYNKDTHDIADKYQYNPRTASLIEPMATIENEGAFLIDRIWVKKIDRIGQHYYEQDGTMVEIIEPDIDVPDGCLQTDPGNYEESHNGSVWIENTVKKEDDQAEVLRQSEISDEHNKHDWKGKNPLWVKNRIENRINSMSLVRADKDILISLFKKIAMLSMV